jgi:hypothetical protein
MADSVSVLAVTLVGDEKRRLAERRISTTGRCFLLPSPETELNSVGGSGGHFSKSGRNGAPTVVSVYVKETNPRYTSPLKWPTRVCATRLCYGLLNAVVHADRGAATHRDIGNGD